MLGGGRCHFLPNTTQGSCRSDSRDLARLAQEKYGWNYINNRKQFDALKLGSAVKLPLLGLFASTDIPFELDRRYMDNIYPSLDEMTRTALTALEAATKNSDKGFFLMVEASRIDHAGHWNDPAAQVHEVLAYDKAFASVVDFLDSSDTEGVLTATSDHETGGLAVARRKCRGPSFREGSNFVQKFMPDILSTNGFQRFWQMSRILLNSCTGNSDHTLLQVVLVKT